MQQPYDPLKMYTMQVHLHYALSDERKVLNFPGIKGTDIPAAQAAAWTKGLLVKISDTMTQAVCPQHINTIFFILQK